MSKTTLMKTSSNPFTKHPLLQILKTKCKTLKTFKQTHAQLITTGLILHTYPLTQLLSTLLSSTLTTSLSYALTIFNQSSNPPTIFIFNTLISSILTHHNQHTHLAFSLYNQILSLKNIKPNSYTYPSLFKACGSNPIWVKHGQALHTHVLKFLDPIEHDHFVIASLVSFYSKCGKFRVCKYLFDRISRPDLGLWNCMLTAYNLNCKDSSLSMSVLCLFGDMQKSLIIKPNEVSLVALINACADLGAFSQGIWAHTYAVKNNLKLNLFVVTSLIDLYVNCGFLGFARQVFDELPEKDVFCYNAMIRGFATHGYGLEGIDLFKSMISEGLSPDDVTMVLIISACSHVGLVDEGREFFYTMREKYGVEPKLEHYGCLVDLLGRAGRLNEAMEILHTMPMKPNAIIWRSLLGASRNHGNLQIAEVALDNLVNLEPETSGNYVLLSNIYAHMNKWEGVKSVRRLMKDHGIDKVPGTSVLEIDGAFHEFLTADKTHPRSQEIYLKIDEINKKLHEYGHKARTVEVLFDLEEEDREDALSYHSERLAIAFALISSECGSPIRIIKNLRVCVDCHNYTKLVSIIYKREIIVRDRNRFHRFQDGSCSCLDYW
uniref:pentatricopeptide repeat-containing protein At5g43790 n=1 Tax=Erigeron canadensis TaxID=72917 RepID=UPI001CB9B096|nr:pentatricopeptide repeat-containing protein At5g43790 [Erigeron canadensis]